MFKKLLAFIMMFNMFLVQANAATGNNLKAAFDDLNYSLSVEWDQQDKEFYNAQLEKFVLNLKDLEKQGVSNKEMIDFTISQVKDQKLAKDLEIAITMMAINKLSQAEAHRFVRNAIDESYSRGASWAGSGSVIAGVVVLVLFVAVAAVIAGKARVGEGCYEVYTCEENCVGGACWEDCAYRCVN